MSSIGWIGRTTRAVSGVCGKDTAEEGGPRTPPTSRIHQQRTTNLIRAAVLPTSNKSTSNHINPPPQTWSSTTLSPPSARSALTTYVKLLDNRPFRRDHEEEDLGWAHGAAHLWRWKPGRQVEYSAMADVLRITACDRCPQHHVRRCLPPLRRQLQGCPAVSSHQGLQQRRGGLHPVRHKHHTRHHPQDAYAER